MTPQAVAIAIFSYFFPGYSIIRFLDPKPFERYNWALQFFLSIALSMAIYSILGLVLGNRYVSAYRLPITLPILIGITITFLSLSFLRKGRGKEEKIKTGTIKYRLEEIRRREK